MEALSGAASGIAVVSLTIQLIQSVALVREFIQDVKGASKELYRLVGKLELLNALLEDAQKVLEQQSSLQEMHFPTPSMAIFKCLQDCDKSIQPLVDIVKKLTLPQSQSSSSTARLKSEIKLGLKTKEITALETRIQHDIDLLTNSLSINQSGILMNLLPALLRNQEKMLKSNNNSPVPYASCSDLGSTVKNPDTVSSFAVSPVRYSQQTILVRSAFERLGLYRSKVIRYQDQRIEDSEGNFKSCKRDILWTANEVSAMWKFLGFGMTFTQQHPYGSIFPSLRMYPMGEISADIYSLLFHGSVQQLQKEFNSGALHPFLRTAEGYSLLHIAAVCHRSDMCRLLLGYGVKPELSSCNQSPLSLALNICQPHMSSTNMIDTYRCFLDDLDLVHELKRLDEKWFDSLSCFRSDEAQWLWQKGLELSVGADLRSNQQVIIRRSCASAARRQHRLWQESQFPAFRMSRDILSDIQYGRCQIIQAMFTVCEESMYSYIAGARFLDWLVGLDLDPELCVVSERADRSPYIDNRRIVFERNWERKWVLGFEWVFDHQAPGYSLLSEFPTLTVEGDWAFHWPFDVCKYWKDRSGLFNRRVAAKERKERARLGQKQPRSQMPGVWKW